MNKIILQSQIKSKGTAYALWFFLGAQHAYMNNWGIQIVYWVTAGGFFIWHFIELFLISGRIDNHNMNIAMQIDDIEKKEKQERDDQHKRDIMMMAAISGNKSAATQEDRTD
ncbi:MAG: TM2 domain-containing protein [Cyclobacteriaceae bacterium]|nr:TM2 domain-containing protein [Cyclobacteriaceae bacterium]